MLKLSKQYIKKDKNDFSLQETKKLQDLIKYHSELYYNKQEPIISDVEYDDLFKKLEFLEKKYSINSKQTSLVGAEVLESTFKKVKHSRPMISLDNTYNNDDLNDFNTRVLKRIDSKNINILEYTIEFKFDGLGIELIYDKGELFQAITRGNGSEGEDVTVNILQIQNIPKTIAYKDYLEVRGEVVMPISVFNKLNEEAKIKGTKVFSNPRNAASGSIRMKDANETKKRKLKFFVYDLANFDDFRKNNEIKQYFDVINNLESLNFEISSYFKKINGISQVINEIKNFGDLKQTLDFEIDGLVLKVNNIDLWNNIGWTEHHPRYAIAYKFPAEISTTKILSVEHSIGRTGTITPVANLEPVNIGGVIVKRATLHNYDEVDKLDVKIGDNVFIKRAGEVIPKIISVVKTGDRDSLEKIFPPEYCPSCKTKVKKDEDKVRFYCPNNLDCPAKHSEKLAFAAGKQGFDIDGFGERQVALFLELGIIHNLVDIFKIGEKADEILGLEGFQEKSVKNLISGIEKAKKVNIATLLTALGISGVGKKTAKTLSKLFCSKNDLINFTNDLEFIEKLDDIGPEIAKNIIAYFGNEAHKRILEELVEILDIDYYKKKNLNNTGIFFEKKACITGSFDGYKRDDLIKMLEEKGGEFVSQVSKNTDFLIAGEKAGSKLEKAKSFGIEVLDLHQYFDMLKKK